MNSNPAKLAADNPPEQPSAGRTKKVLGLFMAIVLAASTGCGSQSSITRPGHQHIDSNRDGYCDEDGDPMPTSSGTRSTYHGGYYSLPHYGGTTTTPVPTVPHSATISSGTHGGIGSSSIGSGG